MRTGIKRLAAVGLALCLMVTGAGRTAGNLSGGGLLEKAAAAIGSGMQIVYAASADAPASRVESAQGDNRIRVDLNANDGRQNAYSPVFYNWKVKNGTSASETINGVKFTLCNGGTTGSGIRAANYKRLIESDDTTPYLTMDGVLIDGAGKDGTIRLDISGLSAGTHTLTTWHSFFDDVQGSRMSVTINGKVTASGIPGPSRVRHDADAGISYSSFEVSKGETVTVLIKSEGNNTYRNAILNAFEIDGEDPLRGIKNAVPADAEWHHEQKNGLSWTAADGAASHDVYLGTSYAAVSTATRESAEYKGEQTETTYTLPELSPFETYYWRVDEIFADGTVKGETRAFEIGRLAFPTAEGYGRYAKAGRGGRIIEVANLNDSGEGSLRQAVEVEKGPRIVVFKVGGVIKLKSKLTVPSDGGNLYVAGQTAPGDGITLTHYNFGIYYASDVVIRDVRVRVGDGSGVVQDGMGMAGANYSIIDHCSISWTTDEGTSSRGARNISFQHNIIAEALNNSIHYNADDRTKTEWHSFAGSISGNVGSYHHNLLVNCTGRNWSLAGGMEQDGVRYAGKLDVRNNVVYNWKDRTTDGGVGQINFVNNYYKQGAVSKNMNIFSIDGDELNTGDMQMAYLSGNKMVKKDGSVILSDKDDPWKKAVSKFNSVSEVKSDVPFFESYVDTETADEAYASVLADVGANMPKQDKYDMRYIQETRTGTFTYAGSKDGWKGIIDSQKDVGGYPDNTTFQGGEAPADRDHDGMPDEWEQKHGLNPQDASDANGCDLSSEYYTNVEMYLNELAGDPVTYFDGAQTETPKPTNKPTATPKPTDAPKPTEKPDETDRPTDVPKPTERPDETDRPTDAPKPTEKPDVTDRPTDVPKPTEKPDETDRPTGAPKPTEKPDVTEKPALLLGDTDLDGSISATDALYVLRHVVKLHALTGTALEAADVTGDQQVTADDALQILKYTVKLIDRFI